jgi:hypothetical protein
MVSLIVTANKRSFFESPFTEYYLPFSGGLISDMFWPYSEV